MPEYKCECCNYKTNKKSNINNHYKSKKHCRQSLSMVEKNDYPDNVIFELIKQNKEFKDIILEQNNKILDIVKDGKNVTNNNTLNNTNNILNNTKGYKIAEILEKAQDKNFLQNIKELKGDAKITAEEREREL